MILLIWIDLSGSTRSNRITGCGDLVLKRQGVQITFCHVLTAQLVTFHLKSFKKYVTF